MPQLDSFIFYDSLFFSVILLWKFGGLIFYIVLPAWLQRQVGLWYIDIFVKVGLIRVVLQSSLFRGHRIKVGRDDLFKVEAVKSVL